MKSGLRVLQRKIIKSRKRPMEVQYEKFVSTYEGQLLADMGTNIERIADALERKNLAEQ
jgi:hypothetical protein